MIAKSKWFKRRKYGGWGISPQSWQGWIYIIFIILPFIIFHTLPFWENNIRLLVTVLWISFLIIDVTPIMITLKKDEREQKAEAISERNAAWFMMMILVIGIVYDIIRSALNQNFDINWFMAIALFGGALVKTISNIVLDKRGI